MTESGGWDTAVNMGGAAGDDVPLETENPTYTDPQEDDAHEQTPTG